MRSSDGTDRGDNPTYRPTSSQLCAFPSSLQWQELLEIIDTDSDTDMMFEVTAEGYKPSCLFARAVSVATSRLRQIELGGLCKNLSFKCGINAVVGHVTTVWQLYAGPLHQGIILDCPGLAQ